MNKTCLVMAFLNLVAAGEALYKGQPKMAALFVLYGIASAITATLK